MFDKMVKMRNKKAFTLVEMLVVIAIIAILVAIVVPIVGKSTTKARAATNAANLRAVEGQLSTVRVSNPDLFTDVVEDFGEYVSAIEGFKDAFGKLDVTGIGGWILSSLGLNSQATLEAYKLCHFTDDDKDGTIEIKSENGNSYKLTGVPLSVGVSAGGTPGMEVPEGTPMTIWISETGVVATYETTSGAYVNANFAEVAETGEFNSTPSGGDTAASLECAIKHQGPFTDNGDGKTHTCEHCGATTLKHAWNVGILSSDSSTCKDCPATCDHTGHWQPEYGERTGLLLGYTCEICGKYRFTEPAPSQTPENGGDSGTGGGTGGTGGDVTPVEHTHKWELTNWREGRKTVYGHYCTDETCEQHTAHEHDKAHNGIVTYCTVCKATIGLNGWERS